jgi:hypothetical protein
MNDATSRELVSEDEGDYLLCLTPYAIQGQTMTFALQIEMSALRFQAVRGNRPEKCKEMLEESVTKVIDQAGVA